MPMVAIHETAYPRFKSNLTSKELREVFTLSTEERDLLNQKTKIKNAVSRLGFALLLKCYQYLGRPIQVDDINTAVKKHMAEQLSIDVNQDLSCYPKTTRQRHIGIIRGYLNINLNKRARRQLMKKTALDTAATKENLADIINRVVEDIFRDRYELPAYQALVRLARAARTVTHYGHYYCIHQALSSNQMQFIEGILRADNDQSLTQRSWLDLKEEPKQPTDHNMKNFMAYVNQLRALRQQLLIDVDFIAPSRLEHLRDEAMMTDCSDMRKINKVKRYALVVIFIYMKLTSAVDDLIRVFIVWIKKIENKAKEKFKNYRLEQAGKTDDFVLLLYNMLLAVENNDTPEHKIEAIEEQLGGKTETLIEECRSYLGLTGNKHVGWMIKPYKNKRTLLFNLLENITVLSSSQDKSIEVALRFIKHYRSSRKEWIEWSDTDVVQPDLDLLPEPWFKVVTGLKKGVPTTKIHRHSYEIAVFHVLMGDLSCSDAYVEEAFIYDDPNKQFITWEEFNDTMNDYCRLAKLPADCDQLRALLQDKLRKTAQKVDDNYLNNPYFILNKSKPILKKSPTKIYHPDLEKIKQAVMDKMPKMSIVEAMIDVENWLNLSVCFKPLSGKEHKIVHYPSRFIATILAYGCNMGPTQAERCLTQFSRKQIAWLFHHHITEKRLKKASTQLINHYHLFALPKHWGPGDSASVDGTFWDMYTQNLLAAHHIRYGRYGGVGYYHVSDQYIALFSNFISSAVHESVYLLDDVVENDSDIKINKVHGDSWAQSEVLFGLAFLMNILILPRIKRFKHLYYYKVDPSDCYEHIHDLFTEKAIDWELIKIHYHDMLRVVMSIQKGKVKSSTILRKLCSKSRKNKLYFAFRELGRVIRTEFLLNYIDDLELRQSIQAATCKSEEFNDFIAWIRFGGGGVLADNMRFSQRKMIKCNHLLANILIFHTVAHQTKAINTLRQQGVEFPSKLLADFSPYWREHINRFGVFSLNMDKSSEKVDYNLCDLYSEKFI